MLPLYKNIKSFRLSVNMSQETLAKLTGYTDRSSIARIEKGEIDLPQSKIIQFAKALGVTPGTLMGWEEENPQGFGASNELYAEITLRMMEDDEFAAAVECLFRMDHDQLQSFRKLFSR